MTVGYVAMCISRLERFSKALSLCEQDRPVSEIEHDVIDLLYSGTPYPTPSASAVELRTRLLSQQASCLSQLVGRLDKAYPEAKFPGQLQLLRAYLEEGESDGQS